MSDPTPEQIVTRAVEQAVGDGYEIEAGVGFGLTALHEEGWSLVRVADSWAGENGGHCILADEVWKP